MRVVKRVILLPAISIHKLSELCRYIYAFLSSVIFNFVYLPFHQAKKLPIWVESLRFGKDAFYTGSIVIDTEDVQYRMIRLGVRYNSWYPYTGICIQNFGTITFKGRCIIGNSSSIYVGGGKNLILGDDVQLTASAKIICETGITIGENSQFGWNTLLMDTDFHYLRNSIDGSIRSINTPITIGKNNWFGCNCVIYRGFSTTDYVTVGSGSKCRGKIDRNYTLWSNDSKLNLLKENVYRDLNMDRNMYNEL